VGPGRRPHVGRAQAVSATAPALLPIPRTLLPTTTCDAPYKHVYCSLKHVRCPLQSTCVDPYQHVCRSIKTRVSPTSAGANVIGCQLSNTAQRPSMLTLMTAGRRKASALPCCSSLVPKCANPQCTVQYNLRMKNVLFKLYQ